MATFVTHMNGEYEEEAGKVDAWRNLAGDIIVGILNEDDRDNSYLVLNSLEAATLALALRKTAEENNAELARVLQQS